MDRLEEVLNRISLKRQVDTATSYSEPQYKCQICQDRELVDMGDGLYGYCECRKQKIIERRIKSSMIDQQFSDASFENYRTRDKNTAKMLETAREYAKFFPTIRHEKNNGFGFMAVVGESVLNQVRDPNKKAELKKKHNSYGLGKTHLQAAVAMKLIREGVQALMVNDTDIMAELRQGQFAGDSYYYEKMIHSLENVELLIWDDLGKAKTSEWVLNQYYRIFNSRSRKRLPICFTTNEDTDSLAEKIGDATASRLYSICKHRIVEVEGEDYRLL